MAIELWLVFSLASIILLAIPGPTVLLVVSYVLAQGRSSAWATVPGVSLGDLTAMTISVLGAGAVLSASATGFAILKLVGASYLVWLGIQLWRSVPADPKSELKPPLVTGRRMFWNAYLVTALNPKSIVFFIAFVPQFINPANSLVPQFIILEATFVTLATLSILIWALIAGQLRGWFQRKSAQRMVNRIGGGFLIGAGLLTAASRRVS